MGKPKKEQNKNIDRHIFKHIQFAEDSLPNKLEQKKKQKKSKKQKQVYFASQQFMVCIHGVTKLSTIKQKFFCLKELRFRTM